MFNNIRLIKKISCRFEKFYNDADDAFQQGCLGFFDALRTFDLKKNTAFSTHLYCWVCKHIYDGMHRCIVDVPKNIQYLIRVLRKYKDICEHDDVKYHKKFLKNKLLNDKNIKEKYINNPNRKLDIQVFSIQDTISNNNNGNSDRELRYIDIIRDERNNPEKITEQKVTQEELVKIIKDKLNDSERKVIMMRYFDDDKTTLKEIGIEIGKSTERIRQIESRAIEKLKKVIGRRYRGVFF